MEKPRLWCWWCCCLVLVSVAAQGVNKDGALEAVNKSDNSSAPSAPVSSTVAPNVTKTNESASDRATVTSPAPSTAAARSNATSSFGRAMNFDEGALTAVPGNISSSTTERGSLQDLSLDDIDISSMTTTPTSPPMEGGNNSSSSSSSSSNVAAAPTTNASTAGGCVDAGTTYRVGEHFFRGCEAACSCEEGGNLRCAPRCDGPFFRRGVDHDDPTCVEKQVDDPCCAILVCSHDTEVEPLEGCLYKNQSYQRGETFKDGCDAVCKCGEAGHVSCKPRCPPVANNSSDRCVPLPDPADQCCTVVLCDVTLTDQDVIKTGADQQPLQLLLEEFLNGSAVQLSLPGGGPSNITVEVSEDQKIWKQHAGRGLIVSGLDGGHKYYIRAKSGGMLSNTVEVLVPLPPSKGQSLTQPNKKTGMCEYKGHTYKEGEEFHNGCLEYCVCSNLEVHCAVIECPTDFGLDVLDPNCVDWEMRPAGFTPSPPHCCPDHVVCRNNGSCEFAGQRFDNWEEVPTKLTGCEKRCYCEVGNITCQPSCSPVPPTPPAELNCPPGLAILNHSPEDDCCLYWICPSGLTNDTTDVRHGGLTTPIPKVMNNTRQSSTNMMMFGDTKQNETERGSFPASTEPNTWLPNPLPIENIPEKDIFIPKIPGPINLSNFPNNKPQEVLQTQMIQSKPLDNMQLIPGPVKLDHDLNNKMTLHLPPRILSNTSITPVDTNEPTVNHINSFSDRNRTMSLPENTLNSKINMSKIEQTINHGGLNLNGMISDKNKETHPLLQDNITHPPLNIAPLPGVHMTHLPIPLPSDRPKPPPEIQGLNFLPSDKQLRPALQHSQPGAEYFESVPVHNKQTGSEATQGRVPEIFTLNPYHGSRPGRPEIWLRPQQPEEIPVENGPPGKEHMFAPPDGYFTRPIFNKRPPGVIAQMNVGGSRDEVPSDEELEGILSHLQQQGVLPPHYTVHQKPPRRPSPEEVLISHLQQQGLLPQTFHPPMRPGLAPPPLPPGPHDINKTPQNPGPVTHHQPPPGLVLPPDQILQLQYHGLLPPGHYVPGQHVDLLPQPALNYTHTVYPDGRIPTVQPNPDMVTVQTIEAIDENTVRLVFSVPPVLVGLHGQVELRYTADKQNNDPATWQQQVLAPPQDLIATPQLEFELGELQPDTTYKIRISIMLRDLANSPSSEILVVKTPPHLTPPTTLPPLVSVEPELVVVEVNSTWIRLMWRKFSEQELLFIDGIQLRYKEIDGKVYADTPLIHRAVTTYTLEDLRPSTTYEIRIFFIPFPGQTTELQAKNPLQVKTLEEHDLYKFDVKLEVHHIKSTSVELTWSGVPYPEDKYVNIFRAIYQSDSGKEDFSSFKIAKRDSQPKTVIQDLKPGTRYRLWLEVYLTNGKIKKSNVQDFMTKPGSAPDVKSTQGKLESEPKSIHDHNDYYGALVGVAIIAALSIVAALILLLILVRKYGQNKAAITGTRKSESAYDNPSYKTSENEPAALNGSSAATKMTPVSAENA